MMNLPLPAFPLALARPLGLLPVDLHSRVLALICNQVLRVPLREGECDFLQGRTLEIHVQDLGIRCRVRLAAGMLRASRAKADVLIEGKCGDLLLLASQQEDPDSLFFSRRLRLQGDTELGLHLKNFLDAQETPPPLRHLLERLSRAIPPSA
ncbi:MAG TPA: SCP2 sterol-binding domain-containing protein [Gammaproteobacteria bacterium]